MTAEANKQVARRYIEEMVNTGNVEAAEEIFDPAYTEVFDGVRYEVGIAGVKAHILGVRETYPDLKLNIDMQIAEGEWVATCITARGTHLGGEWLGLKPSGKTLVYTGVNVDRIVNGRIVEHGGAANMLTPLLEAGLVKVANS